MFPAASWPRSAVEGKVYRARAARRGQPTLSRRPRPRNARALTERSSGCAPTVDDLLESSRSVDEEAEAGRSRPNRMFANSARGLIRMEAESRATPTAEARGGKGTVAAPRTGMSRRRILTCATASRFERACPNRLLGCSRTGRGDRGRDAENPISCAQHRARRSTRLRKGPCAASCRGGSVGSHPHRRPAWRFPW